MSVRALLSAAHFTTAAQGSQMHAALPGFMWASGLELKTQACAASTLLTEPCP